MKKSLFALLLLLPVYGSCLPESLTNEIETPADDNSSTDTTTVAPKFDDSILTEDSISGTKFDRTIHIVFADGGAQITGDVNNTVSADGNHVTVNNTADEKVIYELKGSSQDGSIKLYSSYRQALILDGLDLTSTKGAVINNQGKKKCFIVVKGTNNLKDAASYTSTPDGEDEKAALFSEGQLIFSGDGTLTVTAQGKSGITSDDYVHFIESQVINVSSSAGHGIRGKESVIISDGTINVSVSANMKKGITSDSLVCINGGETVINVTGSAAYDSEDAEYKGSSGIKADCLFEINGGALSVTNSGTGGKGISGDLTGCFNGGNVTVTAKGSNYGQSSNTFGKNNNSTNSVSAKGIKFDGNIIFSGGTVTVNCTAHEGVESKGNIIVKDGVVYSYSKADDAMNSAGTFTIEGGYVCGYSSGNDGLDANGDFYIKGGVVYAIGTSSPEVAIDANSEKQKKLYVQGGTIIAIGGLESGASLTQSCYQASSWSGSTWYSMAVDNDTIAFKTPSSGGTPLVVSGKSQPSVKSGVSILDGTNLFEGMLNTGGTISGGSSVSLSSYTGGNGGWPNNPGGPSGPGGPGGRPGGR